MGWENKGNQSFGGLVSPFWSGGQFCPEICCVADFSPYHCPSLCVAGGYLGLESEGDCEERIGLQRALLVMLSAILLLLFSITPFWLTESTSGLGSGLLFCLFNLILIRSGIPLISTSEHCPS